MKSCLVINCHKLCGLYFLAIVFVPTIVPLALTQCDHYQKLTQGEKYVQSCRYILYNVYCIHYTLYSIHIQNRFNLTYILTFDSKLKMFIFCCSTFSKTVNLYTRNLIRYSFGYLYQQMQRHYTWSGYHKKNLL